MKKQILTLISASLLSANFYSQETYKPCHTSEAMEDVFKNDPSAKTRFDLEQSQLDIEYQLALKNRANAKTAASSYTIPVVFHVLHLNGGEKISTAQVQDAIDILNRDYNLQNADTSLVIPPFKNKIGDIQVHFELAKKDPLGNCTNGINYFYTANTAWDSNNSSFYTFTGTSAGKWNPSKYLNIYSVKSISSGAAGYTYLPGSWATGASSDAIVILSNYVGSIGTGNTNQSRALTHEVGHWLNLPHVWGGTNQPGVACGDDGVSDTPLTMGYTACSSEGSSQVCTPGISENYQNYMDYSYCSRMFTTNQGVRMRSALASSTSGRSTLSSAGNLTFTGITPGYTCAPVAAFSANKTNNCANNTFTFTSSSQLGGNGGSLLWDFAGGTPSTSTNSVEVVSYATPGTYTVSLKAISPQGTITATKNSYISVFNGVGGQTAPALVNFETTGLQTDILVRNDNIGSPAWIQNASNGGNSTVKSIFLNNFSATNTGGHRDFFETPLYDFTNTSSIGFSYYYAYAKYDATQVDSFKVQYSFDCGGTWANILGVPAMNTMATASGGTSTSDFVPTSAQWKLTTINNSLLTAFANKPSVKFRFFFKSDPTIGQSNNIYIDQINITGSLATSISEFEKNIGLTIYPNPTSGSSVIDFTANENDKISISLTDIMGRIIEQSSLNKSNGNIKYQINKNESLSKGIYFININVNEKVISKKLIIN